MKLIDEQHGFIAHEVAGIAFITRDPEVGYPHRFTRWATAHDAFRLKVSSVGATLAEVWVVGD